MCGLVEERRCRDLRVLVEEGGALLDADVLMDLMTAACFAESVPVFHYLLYYSAERSDSCAQLQDTWMDIDWVEHFISLREATRGRTQLLD